MPKTAAERLKESKPEKRVVLDKDFAGVKAGQMLYVANPKVVDQSCEGFQRDSLEALFRCEKI